MSDKDRAKALEVAISQIEKQFGKGAIMRLGSEGIVEIPAIPTGSIGLDAALGVGGFPRGHLSAQVTQLCDAIVSIDPEGLDAWIVVSRLLYEFEKQSSLPENRWNQRPKEQQSHKCSGQQEEI